MINISVSVAISINVNVFVNISGSISIMPSITYNVQPSSVRFLPLRFFSTAKLIVVGVESPLAGINDKIIYGHIGLLAQVSIPGDPPIPDCVVRVLTLGKTPVEMLLGTTMFNQLFAPPNVSRYGLVVYNRSLPLVVRVRYIAADLASS